ncbi:hypothetical protein [Seonamhaeicola sp.]|uniref:hypothetical protein n=1 Tax=Seonamhaeicola sp. TaxID=1912245 RepID=UPI002635323D|nr:hypothetical protein [Seonamhaeicola sp.]
MEISQSKKVSRLDRYWAIIRNGMFLFGLRNRLANIGIDIKPYYWVVEEYEKCEEPLIKDDASKYSLRYISIDEIKELYKDKPKDEVEEVVEGMKKGYLCAGLECKNEIVVHMYIALTDFNFKGRVFKLKSNEAYLFNIWTSHLHRGKNLAPYLRYQVYQLLREQGRNVKYSVTEYFNKSSIKFKKKLNSKNLYLYLNIVLFDKYKWNFTLKKYE